MLKAIDVANFFIYLNKKEFELTLTNNLINHLTYLAYGWFYAKNDCELFSEKIYSIDNHIEIENVYNKFNKYKNNIIEDYIGEFNISIFVSKEIELLIAVYDYYSQFSSNYIQKIICHSSSPWSSKCDETKLIDNQKIYNFFKSRKYFDDIHQ